jgi:hypothetical protein
MIKQLERAEETGAMMRLSRKNLKLARLLACVTGMVKSAATVARPSIWRLKTESCEK